ncbi:MAG: hypothetical protein Tp1122DCM00d2C27307611_40 [Prokaryotic dsDNA virus sp.]|nr:MAG: hypothetical protein Tp1122DCM00d2C27307611_40 [Prokaryotic dsDNA virus sp.]|tara:strand:- start:24137 stop:24415 length:279 start_codon:yes stop_codon:yes gene_type:complete
MDFLMNNLNLMVGGTTGGLALWLLKRIPNEDIYSWVKAGAYWIGAAMTLGLSKWKLTKKLWNATIEPYFIDLVDNTVGAAVQGFIEGLKSDK